VFTPSNYTDNQNDKYPLVYLLNGWSGTYHQWNDITDCQAYADRYGFIIVCPDGLYDSWYINSPAVGNSQYADFFFLDLMPFIAEIYRIDPDHVFISGFSMGGHGALYLFAQKPDLFRSAGSLSGALDLAACWNEYGINKLLGIKGKRTGNRVLERYSVTGQIDQIAASGKPILITCGSSDQFYTVNQDFRKTCEDRHIPLTCITSPGGHDYAYWKSAIGYHFDFFKRILDTL
jgi:S-formylglutathione hydrolase FrmB